VTLFCTGRIYSSIDQLHHLLAVGTYCNNIAIIQCVPLAAEPGISLMSCQQQFLEKFGVRHPPSKSSIWALLKKLETKGTLLDDHTGGRPKMNAGFGSEWDTLYYHIGLMEIVLEFCNSAKQRNFKIESKAENGSFAF
jgi:hypothetical protein